MVAQRPHYEDETLAKMRAAQAEGYSLFPLWRELLADCDTPVSAFRKLANGPYTFLLESVEGGERMGRYSFIGIAPDRVLRLHGDVAEWHYLHGDRAGEHESFHCHDPLQLIESEMARERVAPVSIPNMTGASLPRFVGGAVGYLGYEIATRFERVPMPPKDTLELPDAVMIFTDTLLVFDHVAHRARLVTHVHLTGNLAVALADADERLNGIESGMEERMATGRTSTPTRAHPSSEQVANVSQAEYEAGVVTAKEAILAGDAFQIVLSRRMQQSTTAEPFAIYRALRALNPSPYLFFIDCDDFAIAGASPEMLVRVDGREVALHPIAGTRPRGNTSGSDAAYEAELRYDPKEQAEHIMLVDLGRNDVGRIANPGSVRVTQMMDIERYSHVMHLVSHITGSLRPELTAYDALRAAFPAGTLTGAPKIRAMEIIAELEGERRGVYGGGVGYFSRNGNLDMAIAIRTVVVKGGVAYVQAGAGLVADSAPAAEFAETERKAEAVWRAVAMAETLTSKRPRATRKTGSAGK